MPCAITSHRMMPPKMLTRIASTCVNGDLHGGPGDISGQPGVVQLSMTHGAQAADTISPPPHTHLGISVEDLKRVGHLLRRGAATNIKEIGGGASVQLDDIHRRHRQASAVHHAADVAVEANVVEVPL